jgi:amidohydrolase family protein/ankyrin repeat protein
MATNRMSILSLGLSCLVAASGSAQRPAQVDADVVITRVTVVDVERGRLIPDQDVLLKGDRIVAVTRASRPAAGVRTISGTGLYVIPGLWDMHAHLDFRSNARDQQLPLFVAYGVTGIRVMSTPMPPGSLAPFRAMQEQLAQGAVIGPRLLALASFPVNGAAGIPAAAPAFFKATTQEEGKQLAQYLKQAGYDFIKVYNNVSREGYLGLAEEARKLNLPLGGHEPAALTAIELSNAGQRSIEHSRIFLFNCFPGADSMRKGVLQGSGTVQRRRTVDEYDPQRCAEVFRTFARNDTYITPTHVTRRMDAFAGDSAYRNDARMKYIPLRQQMAWKADASGMVAQDSTAAGRRSFMDFYLKGLTLTNVAYRAGVPVMLGTDAGDSFVFPGASVHDELGELVKAGLTPAEALRAATLSGAKFLGRTADFGTVQAGRFADLVLLDANPLTDVANSRRIRAVVRGGRVFERAALDSMLAAVEVAVRPDAQTKLWVGAMTGDTVVMARALTEGARIDSLDPQGNRRPLNYAAISNRGPAVKFLLERGAGINLTNNSGFTPAHHAVEAGASETLTALIAAGANLTIPNVQGTLPLETARRRGDQAVMLLLEAALKKPG